MDDDRGTLVVLVQSEKGRALWEKISPGMEVRQVTLADASRQNGAMLVSAPAAKNRDTVLERIRNGDINGCWDYFPVWKPTMMQRVRSRVTGLLKRMLGR